MARVSSGFSLTGVNTAASVLGNIKATASKPMRVYEIGLFYTVLSTNPYDIGLARMNAVGTGTITSAAGVAHETADTPVGVVETGWTTARPSITAGYFRRFTIPLVLGQGIIFPFGQGLFIPVSGGLCLQGINASGTTAGTIEGYAEWDE
jgi:hypothetical protein